MKICYVNLDGYGLLNEKFKQPYGGAEVALNTDAHELAKDSQFDVHLLVNADEEQTFRKNRLTVWMLKGTQHNTTLGTIATCVRKFWKKLSQINADVYLMRAGAGELYLLTALFCKTNGKKYVQTLGILPQKHAYNGIAKFARWSVAIKTALRMADAIIALSHDQIEQLRPLLRKKTQVIYTGKRLTGRKHPKRKYFLWAGRGRQEKRALFFAQLAEKLADKRFVMIGTMLSNPPKNLQCIKEVPNEQMNKYYSNAIATISMSELEGFSNVYLESWNNGTPVIALEVDTDSAIKKHNLGYHSGTIEQLITDIKKIQHKKVWLRKSQNSSRYVRENHDLKKQIEKYKQLFRELK